jgi:hypothetical protein
MINQMVLGYNSQYNGTSLVAIRKSLAAQVVVRTQEQEQEMYQQFER